MGKKSIAVSQETHKKLINVKASIDKRYSKIHSMSETIDFLIGENQL